MAISGMLGIWLHVVIDSFYHWDVEAFWPSTIKPLWMLANKWHVGQEQVRVICLWFFAAIAVLYGGGLLVSFLIRLRRTRFSPRRKEGARRFF